MAQPYDVYIPEEIKHIVQQELDTNEQLDFQAAIQSLLDDPTSENPNVVSAAFVRGFAPDEYAVIWNRLVIVYRWVSDHVIELESVRIYPR